MLIFSRAEACSLIAAACALPFGGSPRVTLGNERFVSDAWNDFRGKRLGLVTNHTGILPSGESLIDALQRNPALQLRALFAPEHGLRGTHGAGNAVANEHDAKSGLPVYSLYGKTRRPTAAMLADIDVLLFDIQDVGARTYTYISTLAMVMQAAGALRKTVVVLDRPNPIGGHLVEGPVLDPACSSFIGLYPLALRHGMTIGEIAEFYRQSFGIACDLQVIPMQKYYRWMLWPDTRLTWVPTSPHIPHFGTALVYLSTGPLGGAGINNGIGSRTPFELAVAPHLESSELASYLNARKLPGVIFKPSIWTPTSGFYQDQPLSGVQLIVTDPARFGAVRAGLEILCAIRQLSPQTLRYAASLDRDWGTSSLRTMLAAGDRPEQILAAWNPRLARFLEQRANVLMY